MHYHPLFVHTWGNSQNPPVVFLHGFLGSGQDWEIIAQRLAMRYYCLAPDWPGHGRSPLQAAPAITYADWNAALETTLDACGLEQVTLVGYSLGGRLALDFAIRNPQRLQALIIISANPGIEEPDARSERVRWDAENARRLRTDGLESFLNYWYDLPLFASLDRIPGRKEAVIARRSGQDAETLAQIITALSPGNVPALWPNVPALTTPTLALYGHLDAKYRTITQALAARHPRIRAMGVPFAGHALHVERPDRIAQILCAFLDLVVCGDTLK